MQKILLAGLIVYYCCAPAASPEPEIKTKAKSSRSESVVNSAYSKGLLNEYDVWEFLKESPREEAVLQILGSPDSVWVDEYQESKILYYFIPQIQDYNSVEIDITTGVVTGFEWD